MTRHPMQPIELVDGIARFKRNAIVDALVEFGQAHGFGLNEIAARDFSAEDREQFAQLIGYSVSNAVNQSEGAQEVADALVEQLGKTEQWSTDYAAGYRQGFDDGRARGIEVAIEAIKENA